MAGKTQSKQNVYIASLPRSGSTLLGMILNQGARCAYIGESFYWKKLNPKNEICSCGVLGCKVLLKAYEKIINDKFILKINDTVPVLDSILQSGRSDVKGIEKKYKNDIEKVCIGFEKEADIFRKILNKKNIINSSSNIIIGNELVKKFNWKAIVLMRDPRGVIYSLINAAIRHKKRIPKDVWINYAIDFAARAKELRKNSNVLIVKYEELCLNPIAEIKKICKFLKMNCHKKMLNYRKNKGHILVANHMRFGNDELIYEDKKWVSGLSKFRKQKIINSHKIVESFNHFGYNF
ncbi:sulfotransferase domain-containing protein [Candidatus Parcubacteria bacterium]|nr:sulfotransferase domain-containing protein [Candidatus Parcubacteria bacterium]